MPAKCLSKESAKKAGRKTYHDADRPCSNCGGTHRYVANGGCVECVKVANRIVEQSDAGKAANRERQARYRARQLARKQSLLEDI